MRFCFKLRMAGPLAAAMGAGVETVPSRVIWVVRADRRTGHGAVPVVRTAPGVPRRSRRHRVPRLSQAAEQHAVDPLLVHSVIQAESNYNPFAVSPKGAQGLMQLMPSTARRFGVKNSFA